MGATSYPQAELEPLKVQVRNLNIAMCKAGLMQPESLAGIARRFRRVAANAEAQAKTLTEPFKYEADEMEALALAFEKEADDLEDLAERLSRQK